MKRPQFGLRLVLLIVALTAVIVSWRCAAGILAYEQRGEDRIAIEAAIAGWERHKAWQLKNGDSETTVADEIIEELKETLAELRTK